MKTKGAKQEMHSVPIIQGLFVHRTSTDTFSLFYGSGNLLWPHSDDQHTTRKQMSRYVVSTKDQ